jgi:hypothetical protein
MGRLPNQVQLTRRYCTRIVSPLKDFITERGEDVITETIGFTWMEVQELFAMVRDNLRQVRSGRQLQTALMEQFYMAVVCLTSGLCFE